MSLDTGRFHEDHGIWFRAGEPVSGAARPALFLDRDGVVIEEKHYLSRPEDVVLIPGAAEIIAEANRRDIPVVLVTNQSGIGQGFYGWDAFVAVEAAMEDELARLNARIDAVLACPFYPEHPARKPQPGMLLAAAPALNLDLAGSWIVGDHASDMEAGLNAGLRGGLHVLTGHGAGQRERAILQRRVNFDLRLGDTIADARPIVESGFSSQTSNKTMR
ncbi:MAG TPA: HAD-IIIA family hydrolase [Bryobacteraceae bacterium]|jgi:D-glycero-D-manno-heptose 1,7-bisphosphate phosphatase|nr:HAD-IIIA family hydrolase [Bryobacteraceae bacterium]